VIRVLFFAWFMPSHRRALSVLSHLSQNAWSATLGALTGRKNVPATERPTSVPNLSGRLR
jgi:NADH dehydrogenase